MLFLITLLYFWAAITIASIHYSYGPYHSINLWDVLLIILWPLVIPVALVIWVIEWLKR